MHERTAGPFTEAQAKQELWEELRDQAPRSTGHCGSTAVQCGAFFGYMVAR
jgi:hypothetical protein